MSNRDEQDPEGYIVSHELSKNREIELVTFRSISNSSGDPHLSKKVPCSQTGVGIKLLVKAYFLGCIGKVRFSNLPSKQNYITMTRAIKIFYYIFHCREDTVIVGGKEDSYLFPLPFKRSFQINYFPEFHLLNCIIHPKRNAHCEKDKITLVGSRTD